MVLIAYKARNQLADKQLSYVKPKSNKFQVESNEQINGYHFAQGRYLWHPLLPTKAAQDYKAQKSRILQLIHMKVGCHLCSR